MISVIVPVFNVETYLSECLVSVVNQKYKDLEIILVDDGSTDSSGAICDEWRRKDDRVRVIHKKNGGLSSARNAGLEIAQGDYVGFIDSDDFISPDMFLKMNDMILRYPNIDIVACGLETFLDNSPNVRKDFLRYKRSRMFTADEYLNMIFQHKVDNAVCNKLYKRKCISEIRFKEGRINEDVLFNVEILSIVNKIYYLSEPFYKYRLRKGSITQQANPKLFDFIQNAFEIKRKLPEKFENVIDGYICYEMTNFIATVEKYNSVHLFADKISFCKSFIFKNSAVFFNMNWALSQKTKCIVVCFCPLIYRFLLKGLKK